MKNNCNHAIPMSKACPWCKREKKDFIVGTKMIQYYQIHFGNFIEQFSEKAQGPVDLLIFGTDKSGEVFSYLSGNASRLKVLTDDFLKGVIEKQKRDLK